MKNWEKNLVKIAMEDIKRISEDSFLFVVEDYHEFDYLRSFARACEFNIKEIGFSAEGYTGVAWRRGTLAPNKSVLKTKYPSFFNEGNPEDY